MIPFRIYDDSSKSVWVVINYHPGFEGSQGHYLLAREDDDANDGDMKLVDASNFTKFRFIDFLDDSDLDD